VHGQERAFPKTRTGKEEKFRERISYSRLLCRVSLLYAIHLDTNTILKVIECSESEPTDAALLAASAEGDDRAFCTLVERHSMLVRGTIYRMMPGSADAEDCAQQVFVRVWRAAGTYRPEAKFTTWLLTITRNVVFSELRKKKIRALFSHQTLNDEETGLPLAEPIAPAHANPDREAIGGELREAVDAALAGLPAKQRMALVLHRFEQLPHEEVAIILKTSVPSVKSLIFRAREALRATLKKRGFME
jgi:RNA polymerase sigma-70 factor (ECF subfamily)